MPTWTDEQIAAINDRFWHGRDIPCPLCGAEVRILLSKRVGYPKAMRANCPGCGATASFPSAPARGEDLDEATTSDMVGVHLRGGSPVCPHDGTTLEITHRPILGGRSWYSLRCPRCGASAQTEWTPQP